MNKFLLLFLLLIVCNISRAQINALTDDGKQVNLFQDGTWRYKLNNEKSKSHIDSTKFNPAFFSKSASATFLLKSNIVNSGVYVAPENWAIKTHGDNETNPEYRFSLKSNDGYAIFMTEKTVLGLDYMPAIALINAQKAAVDAKITYTEYRKVNNNKILLLEISGTIRSIKFRYMGYYFSNQRGTTQLICYTPESMYDEARPKFETFLNGFVVVN